ncbi:MAG: hypothetical protein CMK09_12705 [Ponticaulis sp.]|nr:hypothetical protein [Ponticaulis sp.]|tara:strand:- start:14761 stop:15594 length:834 start_codon:yes stop_codon:yes gene_type:complete
MFQYVLVTSILFYLLPFCFSTAIAVWKKGFAALKWSRGVKTSGFTNLAMSVTHMMIAPVVYILNEGFRSGYEALGIPHIPVEFWSFAPLALIVILAVITHDFCDYWLHRLLHQRGFWSIHAVHHSDPDMNHTTSMRIHVIESLMMTATYTLLLSWLGLPGVGSAALALLYSYYNRFVHIDADIHLGPLVKIFATPRFHQWHHAVDPAAHNTNYGNMFSFWDVLFGTYRVPGPCNVPLGFEGSPNHNFFKLMIWPGLELYNWTRQAVRSHKSVTSVDI